MLRFALSRLVQSALTLLLVTLAVFLLARLTGNPLDLVLPVEATPEQYARESHRLGLDQPIYIQYAVFIANAARGDLGTSIRVNRPVAELVAQRWPNTLALSLTTVVLVLLVAFPLGVLAAVRKGTMVDSVARGTALLGQSLPAFWLGLALMWLFADVLGLLPAAGAGTPAHYVLPAVTLALTSFMLSGIVRLLRSGMLEVLDSEYVKLARAKGLSETVVIWKHALKNALIPVLTFAGFYFALLLGGMTIVVETVFAWPGLGRLAYESLLWRDFPIIQAVVLLLASVTVIINLVVDILYAYLDPRIRYG